MATAVALMGTLIVVAPQAVGNHTGVPVLLTTDVTGNEQVRGHAIVGNGQHVAYQASEFLDADVRLMTTPIAGGTPRQLNPEGTSVTGWIRPSPEAQYMVFTTRVDQRSVVWTAPAGGGAAVRIADAPLEVTLWENLHSSPDGRWVAIETPGSPNVLTLYPSNGGPALTMGPAAGPDDLGIGYRAVFSPDSRTLFYSVTKDGLSRIFKFDLTTRSRRGVTKWSQESVGIATVTPDSRTVIYGFNGSYFSIDHDGTNRRRTMSVPENHNSRVVAVSSDGGTMVVHTWNRDPHPNVERLYTAQVGVAASRTLLTSGQYLPAQVEITPDGQWVAFRRNSKQFAIPSTGGTMIKLAEGGRLFGFSLDSRFVFYEQGSALRSLEVATGTTSQPVANWQASDSIGWVQMYPLGGDIVFTAEMGGDRGVYRVPVTGGTAHLLTDPDVDGGLVGPLGYIAPNGKYVTYWIKDGDQLSGVFAVDIGYRCRGRLATHVGTPQADIIVGSPGTDVVVSFGGPDTITTLAGRDFVCSGGGNDDVATGGGQDIVDAGRGKDVIRGGPGADKLLGRGGPDRLAGGKGDDSLNGGPGSDTCAGGPGRDAATKCEVRVGVP